MKIQHGNSSPTDGIRSSFHDTKYLMAPHIHEFAELVYVMDGDIDLVDQNSVHYPAKKGDIIIAMPYQAHGFFTRERCKIWILCFSGSLIRDYLPDNDLSATYERYIFTPSPSLREYIDTRLPDTGESLLVLDQKNTRRIKALLYPIFEEFTDSTKIVSGTTTGSTKVITRIFEYVSKHFREDLSMKDVCSALGYTPSYISHCLSTLPKTNFRSMVNSFRVDYAKTLILTTGFTSLEIALECGFSCERSFHRAFKSLTGMTPKEYRRSRTAGTKLGKNA